jgi:hypothetical protein
MTTPAWLQGGVVRPGGPGAEPEAFVCGAGVVATLQWRGPMANAPAGRRRRCRARGRGSRRTRPTNDPPGRL